MGKVYVPHYDGKRDISDLNRWGEVTVIWRKDIFPDEVDDVLPAQLAWARSRLREFKPDEDFVALVGSPLLNAAIMYILGDAMGDVYARSGASLLPHPAIRVLRYDKIEQQYYPATFR